MSVIANARLTMSIVSNADKFASNLMENGIAPSGALEVPDMPPETSADIVEKLRDQFAKAHGGPGKAGKPMVLLGGTTWKQTMMTPADSQFLESRKFQINEICRWFRVPPHEIQDIVANASQGGGAGIEALSMNFAKKTLLPWTARLEAADTALLPAGQFERYNVNAYARADLKTRYESHNIGRLGGWLSANDVRQMEDMPPIPEGGDRYLEPMNYQEAGQPPITAGTVA
jgi:HK97 family phage portal protein